MQTKPIIKLCLFIVGVVFLGVVVTLTIRSGESRIEQWAVENSYEVIECKITILDCGPFWYKNDDQHIYRAILRDSLENERVAYFRLSVWGIEHAWAD